MRDYGRVHTAFWMSTDIHGLSDDAKLLALYLLTCQHTTIAGVYRLPNAYVSDDLGWPPERVSNGLTELLRRGFVTLCGASKWVFVRKFLVWNPPEGPNQWKAVRRIADSIPSSCAFRDEFIALCALLADGKPPPEPIPSETPSKPLRIQEQEQEIEQEQEMDTPRAREGKKISAEAALAIPLRNAGVKVTSMHPTLVAWVKDGFTLEQAMGALAIARENKPEPESISANYLDTILRNPRKAKSGSPANQTLVTHADREREALSKLMARRKEIGIAGFRDPRPSESSSDYRRAQDDEWAKRTNDRRGQTMHAAVAALKETPR